MTSDDPFMDEAFVGRFNRRRNEEDSVNSCIDEPAIIARVQKFAPRRVIELGCGTGGLTSALADLCSEVVSVDQSPAMIARTRTTINKSNVQLFCEPFENFLPTVSPDMVVSGMAMHLVADLNKLCASVYEWLEPGGVFLFSQRHPIRTANPTGGDESIEEPSWNVSGYFDIGPRTYRWLGYEVPYRHRTISEIISAVVSAGFTLLELDEPQPQDHLNSVRGIENRSSPSVLLIGCRKPEQHPA